MDISCTQPWTSFYIGEVNIGMGHICCRDIIPGGIPFSKNFLDWRNHKKFVRMRELMLENKVHDVVCRKECPVLLSKTENVQHLFDSLETIEVFKNDENVKTLKNEIQNQKVKLSSYPIQCHLSTDHECNFNCIMCCVKHDTSYYLKEECIQFVEKILNESPGNLMILLTGGEPFYSRYTLDILKDLSVHKNAWFQIITNGSLFYPNLLKNLQISNISVSIDSPNQNTFEKIRINSNFKIVENNLKKYIELRKDKLFSLNVLMTVSTMNFTQISDMFDYILSMSDKICFEVYPIIEEYNSPLNIFQRCSKDFKIEELFDRTMVETIYKIKNTDYIYKHHLINQIESLIIRKNQIKKHYQNLN